MSTASSIILTLIGWTIALFLWFAAPLTLHNLYPSPLPGKGNFFVSANLSYFPGQSGVIRMAPSADIHYNVAPGWTVIDSTACINHIAVNGAIIRQLPHCEDGALTMDITPWLRTGANQLEVSFHATKPNGKVYLRSMHSTPVMLAIFYFLFFGLMMHRLPRIDWKLLMARINPRQVLLLTGGVACALLARESLMDITSNDYRAFIHNWFEGIRLSPRPPYTASGSNYMPLYLYMMGWFDRFFPTMSMLYAVKWLSFIGDAFAGFWLWRVISLCSRNPLLPPIAVTLMWLAPSVLLNSAAMAQCDIWWVGLLLAAMYYLGRRRPSSVLFWAGLAFAFKMQAIFLAPLLVILLIEDILPWKRLWILPAVYLLICLPAWLEGVPLAHLLSIYWAQVHTYHNLTETGNLYAWLHLPFSYAVASNIAASFAIAVAAVLIVSTHRHWPRNPTLIDCLLLAALFSTLMPFILPKIINRYFLAGDVFTLAFAVLRPRWFLLPVLMQCASTLSFQSWQLDVAERLTGLDDWHRFHLAALLYLLAIQLLLWACWHYVWKRSPLPPANET